MKMGSEIMIVETLYNLDQEVFYISEDYASKIVKCVTCKHTGKVMIGDEEFVCPKCRGSSAHPQSCGRKWFFNGSGKIGRIDVASTSPKYIEGRHKPVEVQYMLDSTGVHSGTLHNEDTVFPTREAAQAECDRRNSTTDFADECEQLPALI